MLASRISVGFALLLAGCASMSGAGRAPVRVLVFNIHAGMDAERRDNLQRVADIVGQSRADIVLLQEVDRRTRRSRGVDQLAALRSLTGMHGVFGKTIDYDGGEYGLAILSRWPIRSDSLIVLPVRGASPNYETRGALVANIAAPRGRLRVISTHLDASRASYREDQARTLAAVAGKSSQTAFIGGDFNSEPAAGVIATLDSAGYRDAYPACGTGDGLTFPARLPVKRIDYLLITERARCVSARVVASEASDHRPVLFELVLRPRAR